MAHLQRSIAAIGAFHVNWSALEVAHLHVKVGISTFANQLPCTFLNFCYIIKVLNRAHSDLINIPNNPRCVLSYGIVETRKLVLSFMKFLRLLHPFGVLTT
jgi:hypothetical protein